MKFVLIGLWSLVETVGLTWGLYWLSQRPFPGEFVWRGITAPKVIDAPVTLSSDTRGLV